MTKLPDQSNFYGSLDTTFSRWQIAELFGAAGWEVRKPDDWEHVEVHCPWADLLIEDASPMLLHGLVADAEVDAVRVIEILQQAGINFVGEIYGPGGDLLREWR